MSNKYRKKAKMMAKIERKFSGVEKKSTPNRVQQNRHLPKDPVLTPIEVAFRQVNPDYVPSKQYFAENTHLTAPFTEPAPERGVKIKTTATKNSTPSFN